MKRSYQRKTNELRSIKYQLNIAPHAQGSVLMSYGNTQIICSCCVENDVPGWMKRQRVAGGWITAEYSMLPYSTLERKRRPQNGKTDSRSVEIQRLIGRSLRAVIDLKKLSGKTLAVDCDVLQADGGTRTAAITGSYIAAAIAIDNLLQKKQLKQNPLRSMLAAVSVGIVDAEVMLDLDYLEDSRASVDSNIVMTEDLQLVEVQGSGEEATFSRQQFNQMIDYAEQGIQQLIAIQKKAIAAATSSEEQLASKDLQTLKNHFSS